MIPQDASKLVSFVDASPEALTLAQALLAPMLFQNDCPPDQFEGERKAQIDVDGEPSAVLFYHTEGAKLRVSMLQSISKTKLPFDGFALALDNLARSQNCTVLEGRTRRAGLVKSLGPFGWFPESINLVKKL